MKRVFRPAGAAFVGLSCHLLGKAYAARAKRSREQGKWMIGSEESRGEEKEREQEVLLKNKV